MASLHIRPAQLRRAGLRAIRLIVDRTQAGTDRHGTAFAPYSTTPFALPAGGGARGALSRLEDRDEASFFQTKEGALWAIVEGGYAAYKAERYGQDSGQVNLTATGSMIRGLTIVDVQTADARASVTLGFTDPSEAEKAYYHSVSGAGKSRTIRDFMGLTDDELDTVTEDVADGIDIDL